MQKMREVYTQNSKLGDPAAIEKQLQENAQKLDKLMLERKKYEVHNQMLGVLFLPYELLACTSILGSIRCYVCRHPLCRMSYLHFQVYMPNSFDLNKNSTFGSTVRCMCIENLKYLQ